MVEILPVKNNLKIFILDSFLSVLTFVYVGVFTINDEIRFYVLSYSDLHTLLLGHNSP